MKFFNLAIFAIVLTLVCFVQGAPTTKSPSGGKIVGGAPKAPKAPKANQDPIVSIEILFSNEFYMTFFYFRMG